MFDRFTPEARNAVATASVEARGSGHDRVGPEHLLLGVLLEAGSVGARVLTNLGLDVESVRARLTSGTASGTGRAPFTAGSKKVMALALREAKSLGHLYIGTEHLALGVARLDEGTVSTILRDRGIDYSMLRTAVVEHGLSEGWQPGRRSRPWINPKPFVMPDAAAAAIRLRRITADINALLEENERLRQLLRDHGIDPGSPQAGEEPA